MCFPMKVALSGEKSPFFTSELLAEESGAYMGQSLTGCNRRYETGTFQSCRYLVLAAERSNLLNLLFNLYVFGDFTLAFFSREAMKCLAARSADTADKFVSERSLLSHIDQDYVLFFFCDDTWERRNTWTPSAASHMLFILVHILAPTCVFPQQLLQCVCSFLLFRLTD